MPPIGSERDLRRMRIPSGVRVAVGSPGAGIEGFRASHIEAAEAHRLALLPGRAEREMTYYRDVELPALLTADLERARSFVARELGELASEDPSVRRLRETLRLYLHTWGSHMRTAQLLHVHQNTVAYRIRRAEELLGRPAAERRHELETALLLADLLGPPAANGNGGALP
jgi:DNA-binding PucR family transcriptional regulator